MKPQNKNKERFVDDGAGLNFPLCNQCKHYKGNAKCKAFPDSIPDNILEGARHTKPIKGQVGTYIFEKAK